MSKTRDAKAESNGTNKVISKVHKINMWEYNACLEEQYKNKTIHEVLNSFMLIKVKENNMITVYSCKEIKYFTFLR